MMFSQNPNGQVECYTDEGILVGVIGQTNSPQPTEEQIKAKNARDAYAQAMIDRMNKILKRGD